MYKIIKTFRDKYTGRIYRPGDDFNSDETERIKNLLDRKLIEDVPDGAPSTAFIADKNAYQLMTRKELIEELERKGIEYNKRAAKAELIELLG